LKAVERVPTAIASTEDSKVLWGKQAQAF
jgi:hypothetical protein